MAYKQKHLFLPYEFVRAAGPAMLQAVAAGMAPFHLFPIFLPDPVDRPSHILLMVKAEVQDKKWKHPRLKPRLRMTHGHFHPHANDQSQAIWLGPKSRGRETNSTNYEAIDRAWVQAAVRPIKQSSSGPDFYHANLIMSLFIVLEIESQFTI